MLSIAVFNNKGGVGKTTLTCNLASYFAIKRGHRVLVVDCDPQCNATQLIMGQAFATQLYWERDLNVQVTTIKDVLQPIEDGDSNIAREIHPVDAATNRFRVDLIPGHPAFSVIEDSLGAAWHELKGGSIGGIRKTNWNASLCAHLQEKYDLVFFDLGPSLGSINRSVLIGCAKFITPMGADIFSILGVRNIAEWLTSWIQLYDNGLQFCESQSPGRLSEYTVARDLAIKHGFGGYTMQQYITRSKEGMRIPTKAYEEIIDDVPDEIRRSLGTFFSDGLTLENAKLGDVPHLYSLIPLAQSVAAPILDLKASDGLVGYQFRQRDQYADLVGAVADGMAKNLRLED